MLAPHLREALLARLPSMTAEEMAQTLAVLEELEQRRRVELARNDFLAFIAMMEPSYKFGVHLKRLGALLMQVEAGEKDRIAVSMAPRFGKSTMISIYYPAWYLGKHPAHKMIIASHTGDLAVDMARKVRNLMQSAAYREVFPGVSISADAKAAGKWSTTQGGEVYAVGVGGAIAGRGADLLVVDDPISEQDIRSGNTDLLDTVYEYFRNGLRTRLMPGAKVCILHCLVGDTEITLADGHSKLLRDVRPGDRVVSYTPRGFVPAKVLGWASQGLDRVYTIVLSSGVMLQGNERHPLLVRQDGKDRWVTIKNLVPGMQLVRATNPGAPLSAMRGANASTTTTKPGAKILACLRRLVGESGGEKSALPRAVGSLRTPKGCAQAALDVKATLIVRRPAVTTAQRNAATLTLRCSTESLAPSTTGGSSLREECVTSAMNPPPSTTHPPLGKSGGWLSTIATRLAAFVRSCVMRATSSSRSETPQNCFVGPLRTLNTTLDTIVSVAPAGEAEVFDIHVEGTESFLANGVVSHNTRWHQRDLIGRLLKDGALNPDADQYEMFEFPAILTVKNPAYDPDSPDFDPETPKTIEKSLWPEQWSLESLQRTRASMVSWQWNAQYQQNPTASESAIITRAQCKRWPHAKPPEVAFVVQSYDTALTTKDRSDYSVCQTWGVWSTEDGVDNVILLNCVRGRWEFPELKRMAHEQAADWEPDSVIVETKASGQPLVDEMRRSGIFVQEFSPGKGQDKLARLNAVADMFASGQVWFPETYWADEVIEELVSFPVGEHDDCVDACTLALMRIRQGGLLRLVSDAKDDDTRVSLPRRTAYY